MRKLSVFNRVTVFCYTIRQRYERRSRPAYKVKDPYLLF
jgi:hypothetical protein